MMRRLTPYTRLPTYYSTEDLDSTDDNLRNGADYTNFLHVMGVRNMMHQILHQRLTMSKSTHDYQPCQSEQDGAVANLTTPVRSPSKLSKMWQRVKRVFIRRNCSTINPILDGGDESVPTARDTSIVTLMSPPHASNERLMMTPSGGGRYVPSPLEPQHFDTDGPTYYTIKNGDIPELDMRDKVHAWIVHLQNPTPENFTAALRQISTNRPTSSF